MDVIRFIFIEILSFFRYDIDILVINQISIYEILLI